MYIKIKKKGMKTERVSPEIKSMLSFSILVLMVIINKKYTINIEKNKK